MRRYKLLKESDLVPKNRYDAIVYYPIHSPNRNPMLESVYFDEFKGWSGTDKDISEIVDESVIKVLQEYNPERATEIIKGGYVEDNKYNELLKARDYHLVQG